jgi:adenosylcobinamide-GDP ribazoletransferase
VPNCLQREWRNLVLALGFFTRIPAPSVSNFQESDLNSASKYFPLVGWLIGAIAAFVLWVSSQIFAQDIAIILSMIATIYATGAFHEDGLTDAIDGLGGGWEKEQVLTIMQDSRIGSYGAVAIILALLLKYTALSHTSLWMVPLVLIAGHSVSRLCAVLVMATQSYVKSSGKAKPLATQLTKMDLFIALFFGLLPLVFLNSIYCLALGFVALVWAWFSVIISKRIGGYTGDCLGATQQLTEIAFYLGVLACKSI